MLALAILNGTGALSPFPIQIGAAVPVGGAQAATVDPTLVVTGIVGAVAAWNTIKGHKTAIALDDKHAVSDDRTQALAQGLGSVVNSLKSTDLAGKDQAGIINQLVQALNTVPAVSEVLNKPIKEVTGEPETACLVTKAADNAQAHVADITAYYDNKPPLPGDTSADPVVRAVAAVQKETSKHMTSKTLRKLQEAKDRCRGKTFSCFASDNWGEEHDLYIDMKGKIYHICCDKDLWA